MPPLSKRRAACRLAPPRVLLRRVLLLPGAADRAIHLGVALQGATRPEAATHRPAVFPRPEDRTARHRFRHPNGARSSFSVVA